ncbi:hypothetical protein [Roseomonas gilardii]|uniref:hypothetical protein n=1 Tax=Roseomonas gilardii TaxID=257708 RepID=UPI001B7F9E9B|nr:hypothetical protein [Roseomonas gilardii]
MSGSVHARSPVPQTVSPPLPAPAPSLWGQLMERRIGIIPLPVYFLLLCLLALFAIKGASLAR